MVLVAKKLKCDRVTVWRYAKRYKTVREALRQADEAVTDAAELKAIKLIDAEYWPAIHYRLKTKGKDRGYTERYEITGLLKSLDVSELTTEQLERIIAGEDVLNVLATAKTGRGGART